MVAISELLIVFKLDWSRKIFSPCISVKNYGFVVSEKNTAMTLLRSLSQRKDQLRNIHATIPPLS